MLEQLVLSQAEPSWGHCRPRAYWKAALLRIHSLLAAMSRCRALSIPSPAAKLVHQCSTWSRPMS
jgi:hypothetical protein